MDVRCQLVVFSLSDRHFALHLAAVERVVPIVKITAWPKAPSIVLGVVNIAGRPVAAMDIRRRFRLPGRDSSLSDHMIIARTTRRPVALVVDAVRGVIERARADITSAERIVPGAEYVEGVAKLDDGLILIHDLDTFLSPAEERDLERALAPG